MRHMLYWSVLLFAGPLFAIGAARAQVEDYNQSRWNLPEDIVRCESDQGRTRQCAVDTAHGVKLVRQLSDSACVEGTSWGFSRNGIWVAQGCRADFAVGFDGRRGHVRNTLRCESGDGRWRLCPLESDGRVDLVRQLSSTPCILDQSWGRDERGIWVAQGCRGEFRVEGDYARGEHVRCESKGGKERRCKASVVKNVRLIRQLSDSACIKDRTWGWDRDGLWVRGGCRAEFEVR